MRDKEVLQDYRFMAEPNLPPIVLNDGPSNSPHILSISEMKKSLPELRSEARNRLLSAGLSLEHTATLMVSRVYLVYPAQYEWCKIGSLFCAGVGSSGVL